MKKHTLQFLVLGVVYLFSNLLGVHAFAMHGGSNHHSQAEQQKEHIHTQTSPQDHSPDGNTLDCITQGKNVTPEENQLPDTQLEESVFHSWIPGLLIPKDLLTIYFFSVHDPGRGSTGTFNKFVQQLYGKGIIMLH